MLDRLVRVGPRVSTRAELESRYQVYESLVHRHTRLRRPLHKADVFRIPPPSEKRKARRRVEFTNSKGCKELSIHSFYGE